LSADEQKVINKNNKEEDIEEYFSGMSDEHFTKTVSKMTDKGTSNSSKQEIARLKKEASKHMQLSDTDRKLKALADNDADSAQLAKGEEIFKEEKRIVGK
jgi:hypothetical protein